MSGRDLRSIPNYFIDARLSALNYPKLFHGQKTNLIQLPSRNCWRLTAHQALIPCQCNGDRTLLEDDHQVTHQEICEKVNKRDIFDIYENVEGIYENIEHGGGRARTPDLVIRKRPTSH